MSARTTYDVVVVGAGPVGSMAACLASRHELRCLLVDESPDVYPLPRAIHFDADVMRIFQFAGVAQRIEPLTRATTGGVHLGADREPIRRFRVPDAPGDLGWRPHYMFFQPELDAELRQAAQESAFVDVRLGWTVTEVAEVDGGAAVTLQASDGTVETAAARYVIAADGASSQTRKALGISLSDYEFDEPWIIIDAEVPDESVGPDYTIMYCDPARPATYIPGPGRHRRWEFMLLPGETGAELQTEHGARALVESVTDWVAPDQVDIRRSAVYRFHALVAREWRSGAVFLAGDAAHQTPPFYGQGMCHGIRDVRNLLWKIAQTIEGRADEELLDSYQAEREPHVRAVIEAAVANGRYICTLDPDVAAERDRALRARMDTGSDVRSFREVIPGLTSGLLDIDGGSEATGLLFVQPRVAQAGRDPQLLDEVLGMSFALVSRIPVDRTSEVDRFEQAGGRIVEVGEGLADVDGLLTEWFDAFGCAAALVRPDRYVFGVATDMAGIQRLLGLLHETLPERQAALAEERA